MVIVSLAAGLISGITGLGGGIVLVPLFVYILRFSPRQTAMYSNACMIVGSGAGVIVYTLLPVQEVSSIDSSRFLQTGYVDWGISLCLSLGGLISSPLGVKLHQRISPKTAQTVFAVFLAVVSLKIFIGIAW